jgi:preprotein translocase subunit SecY
LALLTRFAGVLRNADLRRRLVVTLVVVAVFRLGQVLPVPGVDVAALRAAGEESGGPVRGLCELLTGGGLSGLSVLPLGIVPVVVAGWLVGPLAVVIPRLHALRAADEPERLAHFTRYLAVLLGAVQGVVVVRLAVNGRLPVGTSDGADALLEAGVPAQMTMVACMTAGTAVLVRLCGLITERGFGWGPSVLFFTQVAAVLPGQVWRVAREVGGAGRVLVPLAVLLVCVLMTMAVTVVQQAGRRVPTQRAKRMVGRDRFGGASTYIPIHGAQAGFGMMTLASLLLLLPAPPLPWLVAAYVLLVIVHALGRTAGALNVVEVADDLKRSGRFVPGIRPGGPTAEYLGYIQVRIGVAGAVCLGAVAVLPVAALALPGSEGLPLTVTSLLIAAGSAHATVLPMARQIASGAWQHRFAPFLRDSRAANESTDGAADDRQAEA